MDRRVKERLIGATILVALIVLIVPELLSGPKQAPVPPLAAGLPTEHRSVVLNLATSKATPELRAADTSAASTAPRELPGPATARAPVSSASTAGVSAAGDGGRRGSSTEASAPTVSGTGSNADVPGASTAAASVSSAPTVATLKAQEVAPPLESAGVSPRSATEPIASEGSAPRGHRAWAVQLGSFASKANAEKLLRQLPSGVFYLVSSGSGSTLRYRVRMGPLADRGAAERAVTKLKAQGHPATIVTPAS